MVCHGSSSILTPIGAFFPAHHFFRSPEVWISRVGGAKTGQQLPAAGDRSSPRACPRRRSLRRGPHAPDRRRGVGRQRQLGRGKDETVAGDASSEAHEIRVLASRAPVLAAVIVAAKTLLIQRTGPLARRPQACGGTSTRIPRPARGRPNDLRVPGDRHQPPGRERPGRPGPTFLRVRRRAAKHRSRGRPADGDGARYDNSSRHAIIRPCARWQTRRSALSR